MRLGDLVAVGLDTPASAVLLLQRLRAAGYDLGDGFPEDGDELIHALPAADDHLVQVEIDAGCAHDRPGDSQSNRVFL